MIRFFLEIFFNLHICIKYYFGLKKIIKNKDKYTLEERYKYCKKILDDVNKKGRITVNVFGLENLPKENGYVMYSNHQGKYDAIGILATHDEPCSVVIKKHRGKAILIRQFLEVLGAKKLEVGNLKGTVKLFKEVEEEVKNGRNYLIFPEGIFYDNKNSLLEFHTGCMRFVKNVKCPVVPVLIYDTYKVFGVNSLKPVSCEVHYLEPLYYDEYKDLTKQELANEIKARIQKRQDERNQFFEDKNKMKK